MKKGWSSGLRGKQVFGDIQRVKDWSGSIVKVEGGGDPTPPEYMSAEIQINNISKLKELGGEGLSSKERNPWCRQQGNYLPKLDHIPTMHKKSIGLRDQIQFMKDYALIGKFVGKLPSDKSLLWWIRSTWKPNRNYDLHLGSKGFFTISFTNMEYHNRILDGVSISFSGLGRKDSV